MYSTLNRISFENSTLFSYKSLKTLHLYLIKENNKFILVRDFDKSYYARVTDITNVGFTACRKYFDTVIKKRILFTECSILPTPEASGMVTE